MKFSHYLALVALVSFGSEINGITLSKNDTKDAKVLEKPPKDDDKEEKDHKKDKDEKDGKGKKEHKEEDEEEKDSHTRPLKTEDYDSDKLPKKSMKNSDKDWATYKEKHNEGKKGVIDGTKDPCSKREVNNFYGAGTCKEDFECMGSRTCMFEPGKKLGYCTGPSSCPEKDDPDSKWNGPKDTDHEGRTPDGVVEFRPSEGLNYKNIPFNKCKDCK